MSKLIPMACLALLGMAGHAWADQATAAADPNSTSSDKTAASTTIQQGATLEHTYTTFGIRYEMKL